MLPLFPAQILAAVRTSNPSSIKRGKEREAGGWGAGRGERTRGRNERAARHAQKRQSLEKGTGDAVGA